MNQTQNYPSLFEYVTESHFIIGSSITEISKKTIALGIACLQYVELNFL